VDILIDMKISKLRENLMRKLCVFSKRFDLFIIGPIGFMILAFY